MLLTMAAKTHFRLMPDAPALFRRRRYQPAALASVIPKAHCGRKSRPAWRYRGPFLAGSLYIKYKGARTGRIWELAPHSQRPDFCSWQSGPERINSRLPDVLAVAGTSVLAFQNA